MVDRAKRRWRCAVIAVVLLACPIVRSACASPSGQGCPASFKIALDIGHTLAQPGATSARGVPEFQYNRMFAQAVDGQLAKMGIATVLIGLDGGPMQLAERTRLARAAGADLFLSLHHDSVQPQYLATWTVGGLERRYSDQFHGYSIFVAGEGSRSAASVRFASMLGTALLLAGFTPSLHHALPVAGEGRPLVDARLGIYRFDQLVVLRTATMPAILFEAAIIVNRQEEAEVQDATMRERRARAVAEAVHRFCSS